MTNQPDEALAYVLADNGQDVWLGNSRGNVYSRRHRTLPVDSAAFWNFTFDEQAQYDVPALVSYVLDYTERDRIAGYVGHSQGTTQMFAALAMDGVGAWIASRVDQFFALAPVAHVGHVDSPALHALSDIGFAQMLARFGVKEFVPDESILNHVDPELCRISMSLCESALVAFSGELAPVSLSPLPLSLSLFPCIPLSLSPSRFLSPYIRNVTDTHARPHPSMHAHDHRMHDGAQERDCAARLLGPHASWHVDHEHGECRAFPFPFPFPFLFLSLSLLSINCLSDGCMHAFHFTYDTIMRTQYKHTHAHTHARTHTHTHTRTRTHTHTHARTTRV